MRAIMTHGLASGRNRTRALPLSAAVPRRYGGAEARDAFACSGRGDQGRRD